MDVEGVADRDFFLDERDRVLRVSRHREAVVLSIWDRGQCLATFRMRNLDAPRLGDMLLKVPGEDAPPAALEAVILWLKHTVGERRR